MAQNDGCAPAATDYQPLTAWDEAEHRRREANQWSVRRKRANADFVVNNETTPAVARRDVRRILRAVEGK